MNRTGLVGLAQVTGLFLLLLIVLFFSDHDERMELDQPRGIDGSIPKSPNFLQSLTDRADIGTFSSSASCIIQIWMYVCTIIEYAKLYASRHTYLPIIPNGNWISILTSPYDRKMSWLLRNPRWHRGSCFLSILSFLLFFFFFKQTQASLPISRTDVGPSFGSTM